MIVSCNSHSTCMVFVVVNASGGVVFPDAVYEQCCHEFVTAHDTGGRIHRNRQLILVIEQIIDSFCVAHYVVVGNANMYTYQFLMTCVYCLYSIRM